MRYWRQDGPGMITKRLRETGPGLLCALLLLAGAPAAADTLGGVEPLPPPGAYFSAYVSDSATGLPLAGADLYVRNPQAYFTVTRADSGGWAHVSRKGLPYNFAGSIQVHWVTAAFPGYVAKMAVCGNADTSSRVLRFALSRATAQNSITFTGTLIDSATRAPIPGQTIDVSHGENGGWMTYVTTTDDSGKFAFAGIPAGHYDGTFWVRKPNGYEAYFPVSLSQQGKPIVVSGLSPTALAAPRVRQPAAGGGKSAALFPFRSRNRDAAGRRKD